MDIFQKIAVSIIKQQESLIGPVAVDRAKLVDGLEVSWPVSVTITGNPAQVIDALVDQYRLLFGQISVEVCKEAASSMLGEIATDQLPNSLR